MFFNRTKRLFLELLNRACQSPDPHEQVRCAEEALALIDEVNPWPRSLERCRRRTRAVLYGVLGQAFGDLAQFEPSRFGPFEDEAHAQAEQFFRPEDGEDWVMFQLYRSQSGITRQGATLKDFETAIQRLQGLCKHPVAKQHVHFKSSILRLLTQALTDIQSHDLEEDRERAIQYGQENVASLSGDPDRMMQAMAKIILGQAYIRRLKGSPVENRKNAIEWIEAGIALIDQSKAPFEWAQAHAMLSMAYDTEYLARREDPEHFLKKAIAASDVALSFFSQEDPRTRVAWARVHFNRANIFARRAEETDGKYHQAALKSINQALSVFTEDEFPDQHSELLGKRASLKSTSLDPANSEDIQRSLDEAKLELTRKDRASNPIAWATAQARVAGLYFQLPFGLKREEHLEESIRRSKEALEIIRPSVNKREWMRITGNLANAYAYRLAGKAWENMEKAIHLQEEVLEHLSPSEDSRQWAEGMMDLAESYLDRQKGIWADNVELVIHLLESAAIEVNRRPNHERRYRLLKLTARAYNERVRGDSLLNAKRALSSLQDAWEGSIEEGHPDYLIAAKLSDRIRELTNTAGEGAAQKETGSLSGTMPNLATDQENESSTKSAVEQHRDQMVRIDKDRHPIQWVQARVLFAEAILHFGSNWGGRQFSFPNTIAVFREALDAIEEGLRFCHAKGIKNDLGSIHRVRVRVASALALLHNMADYSPDGDHFFYNAQISLPPGEIRSSFEKALESQVLIALESPIEANERAHLYENLELGMLHVYLRQWEEACLAFQAAGRGAECFLADVGVTDAENQRILRVLDDWMELAPFSAAMSGKPLDALRFVEQGRARLLTRTVGLRWLDLSEENQKHLSGLQAELLSCEGKLNSRTLIDRMAPLKRAIEIRSELKDFCKSHFEALKESHDCLDAMLGSVLTEGICIVVPMISAFGGYVLLACLGSGEVNLELIPTGSNFDYADLSNAQGGNAGVLCRDLAIPKEEGMTAGQCLQEVSQKIGLLVTRKLHEKLISLGKNQIKKLIVLPQGIWGHLPLALGYTGMEGTPILEHYTFSLAPSLRLLHDVSKKNTKARTALRLGIVANPTHVDERIAGPLEFAEVEAGLVSGVFVVEPGDLLTKEAATRDNVLDLLERTNVWHFACHGGFDQELSENTQLYLAGADVLGVSDLLEATNLSAPELVVLSACETGLFDQKELPFEFSGLVSAFLQTGATGVIVSLWKISDLATCFFMRILYERVFDCGESVSEALRRSQLELRDSNRASLGRRIEGWATAGDLKFHQVEGLANELLNLDSDQPFRDPFYWGGFVYYGAPENQPTTNY